MTDSKKAALEALDRIEIEADHIYGDQCETIRDYLTNAPDVVTADYFTQNFTDGRSGVTKHLMDTHPNGVKIVDGK